MKKNIKKLYILSMLILCLSFNFMLYSCGHNNTILSIDPLSDRTIILSTKPHFDYLIFNDVEELITKTEYIIKCRIIKQHDVELVDGYTFDDLVAENEGKFESRPDRIGPLTAIRTPFDIEVLDVYSGNINVGDVLIIEMLYGNYMGYELQSEYAPELNVGEEYIFFLSDYQHNGRLVLSHQIQSWIPLSYNIIEAREKNQIYNELEMENRTMNTNDHYFNDTIAVEELDVNVLDYLYSNCDTIDEIIATIEKKVEKYK